jgi:signal peptidase I
VPEIKEASSVVTNPKDVKNPMAGKVAAAKSKAGGDSWIETGKTIVYALLIALVIRTFLFQPFYIPSGSMENTLLVGDYLFLEKFAYGYSRFSFPFGEYLPLPREPIGKGPQRGDVVVFKMPNPNSPDYMKDFIKRVIGVPGDRVQMVNGQVWLNGKPVPKVRASDYIEEDPYGGVTHVPRFKETLPDGKSYYVLDRIPDGPSDNTPVYVVPPGHYFMMGDNRDNSDDSRADVGYVPAENVEGRAVFIFFSNDGNLWEIWKWPWTVRFRRLFTIID